MFYYKIILMFTPLFSIVFTSDEYESLHPLHRDQLELVRRAAAAKYEYVFPIQFLTLPKILCPPYISLIAQAQGGAGKTAAFMMGTLAKIDTRCNFTQVVCLGITRELVIQIVNDAIVPLSSHFDQPITYDLIVQEFQPPDKEVVNKCEKHIVIGTPGRIASLLNHNRAYLRLGKVHTFILDEADTFISREKSDIGDQVIK